MKAKAAGCLMAVSVVLLAGCGTEKEGPLTVNLTLPEIVAGSPRQRLLLEAPQNVAILTVLWQPTGDRFITLFPGERIIITADGDRWDLTCTTVNRPCEL